jgi:hypothetical protein
MTEAAVARPPITTNELVRALVPMTDSMVTASNRIQKLPPTPPPPGQHDVYLFANRFNAVSPRITEALTYTHEAETGARKGAESLSETERTKYRVYASIVGDMKEAIFLNPWLQENNPDASERATHAMVGFYNRLLEKAQREQNRHNGVVFEPSYEALALRRIPGFVLSPLMEDVLSQSELPTVKLEAKEIADAGRDVFQAINNKLAKRPELRQRGFSLFMSTKAEAKMTLRDGGLFEKTLKTGKDGSISYKYKYSVTDGNGMQKVTLHVDAEGVVTSLEALFVEMEGEKPQHEVDTHMAYQKALGIVKSSNP